MSHILCCLISLHHILLYVIISYRSGLCCIASYHIFLILYSVIGLLTHMQRPHEDSSPEYYNYMYMYHLCLYNIGHSCLQVDPFQEAHTHSHLQYRNAELF